MIERSDRARFWREQRGLSLAERIARNANSERAAVDSPDGVISYGQLLARAGRLAERLARETLAANPEARKAPVLVYGHKEPAMVVAIVAALFAGRPYVPVDTSAPPARIARILDLAVPGDVVLARAAPDELARDLAERDIATISLDPVAALLDDDPALAPDVVRAVSPEDVAYILFTSGTTGAPKGVRIPYRGLDHFASWLLESQGFVPGGETFLNQAPFNFDLSVMDLYGALLSGGTLFCVTQDEIADPRRLFARLDGAPLTAWVSTPSFARFCLAEPRFGAGILPLLRRFLFCGEALPAQVARELYRRFPEGEVWNTYGPTETTVAVTGVAISPEVASRGAPLTIGWPFPDLDVWAATPTDPARRRANGESGELVIAGPQVALGYVLAPDAPPTNAFFRLPDGRLAYRTGDLGHVDPVDGLLYWDARLDRQIKLHGYRLELGEIEAHLREIPGVADAAVFAVERQGRADHLEAFVVLGGDHANGGTALPADELGLTREVRSRLAAHLPRYALPRTVRPLASLPLTVNGKLDRRAIEGMLG